MMMWKHICAEIAILWFIVKFINIRYIRRLNSRIQFFSNNVWCAIKPPTSLLFTKIPLSYLIVSFWRRSWSSGFLIIMDFSYNSSVFWVKYSIQFIGKLLEPFMPSKRLRQGDILSPFSFLFVADTLIRLQRIYIF